jgi:HD-GYP domain-containing protein (c-di-GMP phosphodiesterase class II)
MEHGLLITDMGLMGDLIKLNLRATIGCKVKVVNHLDNFKDLLSIENKYKVIIAHTTLGNKDIVDKVIELCLEKIPHVAIVFMGHLGQDCNAKNVFHIPHYEDVSSLVSLVAKILKLLEINQPSGKEDDYFEIPLSLLITNYAEVDLWSLSSVGDANYIRVALQGEDIAKKITMWSAQGINNIFVETKNKFIVTEKVTFDLLEKIECGSLSKDAAFSTSTLLLGMVAQDQKLLESLSVESKKAITAVTKSMEKVIKDVVAEFPIELKNLVEMMNKSKNNFMQNHIALVTYFSQEICRQQNWYSLELASKLFMLTYFHDIILVPLYDKYPGAPRDEIALKSYHKLSKEEAERVHLHPILVSQLVRKLPSMPVGLDQLILQHHGNFAGVVEDSLEPQEEIGQLAKVLYVAELFTGALMQRAMPFTDEDYKVFLEALESKLAKKSYQKLIKPLYLLKV